ncbi:MAG: DUF2203 domain-containing protein [Chloroflexota bacterium]|nr:DUF2203 domain-containing protein [Chloroflexota bacterium]
MTRFYDLDDANARLPELRVILAALREQRAELIRLRDVVLERQEAVEAGGVRATEGSGEPDEAVSDDELRLIRLRMQGVIDQMQAGVARIDALGIALRDIDSGLIDFPALASGRQVCLCWRLGEDDVAWWHELTAGFSGRLPLIDLA